jgi:hypothetical protein
MPLCVPRWTERPHCGSPASAGTRASCSFCSSTGPTLTPRGSALTLPAPLCAHASKHPPCSAMHLWFLVCCCSAAVSVACFPSCVLAMTEGGRCHAPVRRLPGRPSCCCSTAAGRWCRHVPPPGTARPLVLFVVQVGCRTIMMNFEYASQALAGNPEGALMWAWHCMATEFQVAVVLPPSSTARTLACLALQTTVPAGHWGLLSELQTRLAAKAVDGPVRWECGRGVLSFLPCASILAPLSCVLFPVRARFVETRPHVVLTNRVRVV